MKNHSYSKKLEKATKRSIAELEKHFCLAATIAVILLAATIFTIHSRYQGLPIILGILFFVTIVALAFNWGIYWRKLKPFRELKQVTHLIPFVKWINKYPVHSNKFMVHKYFLNKIGPFTNGMLMVELLEEIKKFLSNQNVSFLLAKVRTSVHVTPNPLTITIPLFETGRNAMKSLSKKGDLLNKTFLELEGGKLLGMTKEVFLRHPNLPERLEKYVAESGFLKTTKGEIVGFRFQLEMEGEQAVIEFVLPCVLEGEEIIVN